MMNSKAGWANSPLMIADSSKEPARQEPESQAVTVIKPASGWQLINFGELWQFRELIFHLIWRDVKVRYKQTFLGGLWAILQPAAMMVVFTIFFSQIAGLESGKLPYPLFVLAGLLPWTFFSTALAQGGNSVVNSEHLITKIYFPRLAIPLASVGAGIVDFVIGFGFFLALRVYFRAKAPIVVDASILMAPVIFGLIVVAALGVGTMFAALNVAYRDFRYVIPFVIQLWLFATPTIYMEPPQAAGPLANGSATAEAQAPVEPGTEAAAKPHPSPKGFTGVLGKVLAYNPMIALIAEFRHSLFCEPIHWFELGRAAMMVVGMFLVGSLIFRRVEDTFPDII